MRLVLSKKEIEEAIAEWLFNNKRLDIVEGLLTMDENLQEITVEVED